MQSELERNIEALSRALATTDQVTPATHKLLQTLHREVTRLLELPQDAGIADRLEALAVRFEADHPAVGTALRQAIDSLSKAGL
jgi:hypothetical protein